MVRDGKYAYYCLVCMYQVCMHPRKHTYVLGYNTYIAICKTVVHNYIATYMLQYLNGFVSLLSYLWLSKYHILLLIQTLLC